MEVSDTNRPPTCLLCNNYFDRKPHLDLNPRSGGPKPPEDVDVDYFADFRKALNLFCKLLSGGGGGGGHLDGAIAIPDPTGDHFRTRGHPCCSECHMGLLDLLRLETIIRETEVRKQEVLETLKMAVVENQDKHNCQIDWVWDPVRRRLIQSLTLTGGVEHHGNLENIQNPPGEDEDHHHRDYFEHDMGLDSVDELQGITLDTSFVLPDMEQPEPVAEVIFEESKSISLTSDPLMEMGVMEEPLVKRRKGRSSRKQVLEHRIIEGEGLNVKMSRTAPSPHPRPKPCFIPLTRVKVEEDLPVPVLASRPQEIVPVRARPKTGRRRTRTRKPNKQQKWNPSKPGTGGRGEVDVNEDVDVETEPEINSDLEYKPESNAEDDVEDQVSSGGSDFQPDYKSKPKRKIKKRRGRPRRKISPATESEGEGGRKIRRRGLGEINYKSVFYWITDELLIFQNTPVQVQPSGFICLEPNCQHFVEGYDYSTFQNMKAHIMDEHRELMERTTLLRSCPICQENYPTGRSIRKHILSKHGSHPVRTKCTIVCESCWKPMPFSSYLLHSWSHKSEDERAAVVAAGDRIAPLVKSQIGLAPKLRRKIKFLPNRIKDGDFFFSLDNDYLLHKGVLLKFSQANCEFTCREGSCPYKVKGSDYDTFIKFQGHVKACHNSTAEEPNHFCPNCPNLNFTDRGEFRQHIFEIHFPRAVCTSCWKPITTYFAMGRHVWLHMSEEERAAAEASGLCDGDYFPMSEKEAKQVMFFCASCPKQFTKMQYLKNHEKTHIPKDLRQKYRCEECGFEALNLVSLRAHNEQNHSPNLVQRVFKCHICGREYNFRRGFDYRTHMRSHTGETPYVCEICGKGFISSKTLNTHRKSVHTTNRPYQCEFCEKSYKLEYVLNMHRRKAHKELVPQTDPEVRLKNTPLQFRTDFIGPIQQYPCEHCGKLFKFRSQRKYHVKAFHQDESSELG